MSYLLSDEQQQPVELPRVQANTDSDNAGAAVRRWLGVEIDEQRGWATPKEAFSAWRDRAEARGVLVMQLRLGREGLRGFSMEDTYAPLAAVNTAENLQARIFTLMHELAHLASRTASACLEGVTPTQDESIEKWCDRVASASVIPRAALLDEFHTLAPNGAGSLEVVQRLSAIFSTSLRATAVALIHSELVSSDIYDEIEKAFPASDYAKGFGRGGGQRTPERRLGEVGPRAASLVIDAMAADRLSEREARQYLRLDGVELSELATALEASR